ncbi:hypothetical protein KEJ32_03550 [Candidatus Bathyarchaeota archaeon]|nr:hypothetical protein [Candidatus Bathyarchaeota archaeon]
MVSFKDFELLFASLKECPKCRQKDGFWLVIKPGHRYLQCKHCGSMIEFCEVFPTSKKGEPLRGFLRGV